MEPTVGLKPLRHIMGQELDFGCQFHDARPLLDREILHALSEREGLKSFANLVDLRVVGKVECRNPCAAVRRDGD